MNQVKRLLLHLRSYWMIYSQSFINMTLHILYALLTLQLRQWNRSWNKEYSTPTKPSILKQTCKVMPFFPAVRVDVSRLSDYKWQGKKSKYIYLKKKQFYMSGNLQQKTVSHYMKNKGDTSWECFFSVPESICWGVCRLPHETTL